MSYKNILVISFFLMLLNGCASVAEVPPVSKPDVSVKNINKVSYITKSEILKKSSDLGGNYGFIFPIDVEIGKSLKNYAETYIGKVIVNDVQPSNKEGVYLSFKSFDITESLEGFFKKKVRAELGVNVVVKDKNGKEVFTKVYTANGVKMSVSAAHSGTVRNVGISTASAFKRVFEEIASEVTKY